MGNEVAGLLRLLNMDAAVMQGHTGCLKSAISSAGKKKSPCKTMSYILCFWV